LVDNRVLISFVVNGAQLCVAFESPEEIPGNYSGKWYGLYCPDVPRKDLLGVRHGEQYPNQKIINSWGYKSKPIAEIKDLLPEMWYNMCSNTETWGDIRINETKYIPLEQWPGEHQKVRKEFTEKYEGTARPLVKKGISKIGRPVLPFRAQKKA